MESLCLILLLHSLLYTIESSACVDFVFVIIIEMAQVEAKVVVPESVLKKRKREEEWALAKKQELEAAKKKSGENRKLIYNRAKQYSEEYEQQVFNC